MNGKLLHAVLFILLVISLLSITSACQEPDSGLAVLSLNITPQTILAGQTFDVEAEIRNDSDQLKTFEVPVMVNKIAQKREFVTLPPGATERIAFALSRDDAGTYTISIGSQSSPLEVRDPVPATFKLSNLEIKPNESNIDDKVVITADIANVGEVKGQYIAELKVNDAITQKSEMNMLPGSDAFVVFVLYPDSPGTYAVSIGDLAGEFNVLAPIIPIQITPPVCPPSQQWNPGKKC